MAHIYSDKPLTNQYLNDKFDSPFALLACSMRLARQAIQTGVTIQVDSEILNPAYQVLAYIDRHGDPLQE